MLLKSQCLSATRMAFAHKLMSKSISAADAAQDSYLQILDRLSKTSDNCTALHTLDYVSVCRSQAYFKLCYMLIEAIGPPPRNPLISCQL